MRIHSLALAALFGSAAVPAHAAYTTFEYTGLVTRVYAAPGPSDPTDITAVAASCLAMTCADETTVTYSVTYDPARLKSFGTVTLPDAMTNVPEALQPALVDLGDDPGASYTITVSPPDGHHYVFTLADDDYDGYVTPTGIGPYPALSFNGTQVIGLESDAVVGDLEFYSDPARFLLQEQRYNAYVYSTDPNSDFAFAVSTSLDASLATIRDQAAQVPEPATVALWTGGIAVGALSRRKTRREGAGRLLTA